MMSIVSVSLVLLFLIYIYMYISEYIYDEIQKYQGRIKEI